MGLQANPVEAALFYVLCGPEFVIGKKRKNR
jgi:hypothetical protein